MIDINKGAPQIWEMLVTRFDSWEVKYSFSLYSKGNQVEIRKYNTALDVLNDGWEPCGMTKLSDDRMFGRYTYYQFKRKVDDED